MMLERYVNNLKSVFFKIERKYNRKQQVSNEFREIGIVQEENFRYDRKLYCNRDQIFKK